MFLCIIQTLTTTTITITLRTGHINILTRLMTVLSRYSRFYKHF